MAKRRPAIFARIWPCGCPQNHSSRSSFSTTIIPASTTTCSMYPSCFCCPISILLRPSQYEYDHASPLLSTALFPRRSIWSSPYNEQNSLDQFWYLSTDDFDLLCLFARICTSCHTYNMLLFAHIQNLHPVAFRIEFHRDSAASPSLQSKCNFDIRALRI